MSEIIVPGMGLVAGAFVLGATFGGIALILGVFAGPAYTLVGRPSQEKWVKSFICVCGACVLINGYESFLLLYRRAWENSHWLSNLEFSVAFASLMLSVIALPTGLAWANSGYPFGNRRAQHQQQYYEVRAQPQRAVVQEQPNRQARQDYQPVEFAEWPSILPKAIGDRLRGQNGLNN
jgi:hypothetical protein